MERICECEAKEGQLHSFGCRWEYCPFCEHQFVEGCDCAYLHLGLMNRTNSPEHSNLPKDTYENGLSSAEWSRWEEICNQRGRIPYIDTPQLCARCGCIWPDFFMVQDKVWQYYTGKGLQKELLCLECFQYIGEKIDEYNERPSWLPSVEETAVYIRAWQDGDKEKLRELEPEKFKNH